MWRYEYCRYWGYVLRETSHWVWPCWYHWTTRSPSQSSCWGQSQAGGTAGGRRGILSELNTVINPPTLIQLFRAHWGIVTSGNSHSLWEPNSKHLQGRKSVRKNIIFPNCLLVRRREMSRTGEDRECWVGSLWGSPGGRGEKGGGNRISRWVYLEQTPGPALASVQADVQAGEGGNLRLRC